MLVKEATGCRLLKHVPACQFGYLSYRIAVNDFIGINSCPWSCHHVFYPASKDRWWIYEHVIWNDSGWISIDCAQNQRSTSAIHPQTKGSIRYAYDFCILNNCDHIMIYHDLLNQNLHFSIFFRVISYEPAYHFPRPVVISMNIGFDTVKNLFELTSLPENVFPQLLSIMWWSPSTTVLLALITPSELQRDSDG